MVDGAIAGEAETLPQPEHGFESGDCAPHRFEGLEAAGFGHVLLYPEMIAFDPLLEMLGDIVLSQKHCDRLA